MNIYAKNRTPPRSFFGGVFVFWSGIFHTLVIRNHSYYADYKQISNDDFDAWCEKYLAYNQSQGITLNTETIPYIIRYKGEVIPHYVPMTAVQNRDPAMWAEAAGIFGDDFEQLYLMMDHGLFTELARGKMEEPLILYSGLYDSQLMTD